MGRLRLSANDAAGAQAEFARAGRLLDELVQRVPALQRAAFLSVPRRAEVVAATEPELRLPRAMASLAQRVAVEKVHGLVGRSPALQRVAKQLEPIGRSNATVLIRGESGTGKEVLADALHALSPRRHMPLVKVNCAAMVEELLLSELFGHEKGAFTGAVRERKGRFEVADGGTIFLDEIGDISPKAQVALLRVLQEREFERVGGSKTIRVDVRIICATNRDLEGLIAQGRFRSDLYYRLKGVMLELPPLRERLEDLPLLAQHFLERAAKERGEVPQRLSDESLALLARHPWPGNVRELENVIASAAIFADGPIITPEAFRHVAELEALLDRAPAAATVPVAAETAEAPAAGAPSALTAAPVASASDGPLDYYALVRRRDVSLKELRHEIEMQCIRRALEESGGNISEAARLLKMKRSRLSQIVNGETELKEAAHGED
jgi:sigma-54 specific flagellar transcriptional regulator A